MPTQDIGVRWSEEKYATKDEVREGYNMTMIDGIWSKIVEYRRVFTRALDLHNIDRVPYMVVLTQTVQLKVSSIERRLSKILVKTHDMNENNRRKFVDRRMAKTVLELENSYNTGISPEMITHLLDRDLSTLPSQYSLLYNYVNTIRYYLDGHYNDVIDFKLLLAIFHKIQGSSFDPLTAERVYRTEEIETSHYYQNNYIYKAAPIERLADMIDELCNFIRESELSPVIKAIITHYYLDYIMPFDYLSEETISLFAKTILAHFDIEDPAYYLNFERLSFLKEKKLDLIKEECQKTLDLTYYINYVLDLLDEDIKDILDDVVNIEREVIQDERVMIDESEKKEIGLEAAQETSPQVVRTILMEPNTPSSPYVGEANVALPVFPAGLAERDVESIVTNLLEVYPYLKRTQAHFYARHCTIGKHYTISQFKKEEDVAYETARTSMDFLAENGFYSKTKVRNKFVYSPVPRQ